LEILDIVRCFAINGDLKKLCETVIKSRFNYVLEHTVGTKSDHLQIILDTTNSVLLGSSALDIILHGTSPIFPHELCIATPCYAHSIVSSFFNDLGFTTDQTPNLYTPPSAVAVYDQEYIERGGKKVVLINSPTNSVMPVVLAHRSSTDCIFACSGGLFLGYPKLLDGRDTLFPLADTHSRTTQYFNERGYEVQNSNNAWTSPCGKKCPTHWRRMEDALLVTWHNGVVPSDIVKKQNLLWRLASRCSNLLCTHFIFRNPEPNSGAHATHTVKLRIADSENRNVSV
jgi:hypothetical protein